MIVDCYSRFPIIRNLKDDMTCVHSIQLLYQCVCRIRSTLYDNCRFWEPTCKIQKFKKICKESGEILTLSSPHHHQANGLAEKAVSTCKSLWKKAIESKQCPHTALWMYRITPLGDPSPSPYEHLLGGKPRALVPNSKSALQSKHPDNDAH